MNERATKILKTLSEPGYTPMRMAALIAYIEVDEGDESELEQAVQKLIADGDVYVTSRGKVCLPQSVGVYKGTFVGNPKGFGFVVQDDASLDEDGDEEHEIKPWMMRGRMLGDIYIHSSDINDALHQDTVLCRILNLPKQNGKAEGEIIKIIKRANKRLTGTYRTSLKEQSAPPNGFGVFVPDNRQMPWDVLVAQNDARGAVDGQKVVAHLTSYTQPLKAKIVEVLGHPNDPGVDILAIVRAYDIPDEFPDEVMTEAARVPNEVLLTDIDGRKDLRLLPTITIDGEDTKDVDDAITLVSVEGGGYRLSVHIADVAHYVRAGSAIDLEARRRGTSVYLADRVIPMLPHKLSNGICSLNKGCDRLSLSCIMDIDENGDITSHEVQETVIHVDLGTTYTKVNDILDQGEDSIYYAEAASFYKMIRNMKKLAKTLHKRRIKRGSIEFNFRESKVKLDDNGEPIEVYAQERNEATSIIEEFMIAANEAIAGDYKQRKMPFIYRIHKKPSMVRMRALESSLARLGYALKSDASGEVSPRSLAGLLRLVEDSPEAPLVNKLVLRSLQQAFYSHYDRGHFGLASRQYTHFTSPIRRYPDLMVHRLIKRLANLSRAEISEDIKPVKAKLREVCLSCSLSERRADSCARDVLDLKKAQFMTSRIGEEFEGTVSGAASWALFVELENTVEGTVPASSLQERMEFDQDRISFVGSSRRYSVGDKVRIIVKDTDLVRKRIIFSIIEDY